MKYLTLFLLYFSLNTFAQKSDVFHIDSLPTEGVLLNKNWKWHEGDNPEWAKADFDDSAWEGIDPTKTIPQLNQVKTDNPLWLRLKFTIEISQEVVISIIQSGATEIFLNGKPILTFGQIEQSNKPTVAYDPQNNASILKLDTNVNTLAVRYYFQKDMRYTDVFNVNFPLFSARINNKISQTNIDRYVWNGFNIGVPFILFIVHFIFFISYTRSKTNLWYSLSSFFGFIGAFSLLQLDITHSIESKNHLTNYAAFAGAFQNIFLYYTIFLFLKHKNKWLVVVFIGIVLLSFLLNSFDYVRSSLLINYLITLFYVFSVIYMGNQAWKQGEKGGKYLILSMVFYIVFWSLFILSFTFKWGNSSHDILFHLATLIIPIIISVLLGLDFRNTNNSLLKNLEKINVLSIEKQQILATQNETLEKQVAERTAELKHKNRDLEIEAALDKVRSASLAMRHSHELQNVVIVLLEKLKELGLVFDSGAAIHVFPEGSKDTEIWVATSNQLAPTNKVKLPYDPEAFEDNPIILDVWNAHETGNDIVNKTYSFEEKNRYFNYVFKHNGYDTIPEFVQKVILEVEGYSASYVSEKHSLLGAASWSGQMFSETEFDILKRMARVFEQAYTRFLDLQKAEAQAREAEIELSLERVRARTMAMHHSNELGETAKLLFQQVQALGIPAWSCGYNIWEKGEKVCTGWMSSNGILQPPFKIPLTESPSFIRQYESKQKGEDFYTEEVSGEALAAHYQYMGSLPDFGEILKDFFKSGFTLPNFQINHIVNFKQGNMVFITGQPVPDAWDIFKRFAKVFEQTYTRFLDLQKAEAQAREAQIELALERVRARTMAMQHSEELRDTSLILFQQLKDLGEPAEQCTIGIIKESEGVVEISATLHGNKMQQTFRHRLDEPFIMAKMFKSWKDQKKTLVLEIKEEELQKYNQYRNELVGKEIFPVKLLPGDRWITHIAYFPKGILALSTNEPRPAESLQLLERFAIVFQQTYTRFLDLQKAEAQAREAQIEVALERVRSRAMAMQNSNELSELVTTLFHELIKLDLVLARCIIWIFDAQILSARMWMANSEDNNTTQSFYIKKLAHPYYEAILKGWQERNPKWVYELQGDEKKSIDKLLLTETELAQLPESVKSGILSTKHVVVSGSFNNFGLIEASGPTKHTEEQLELLSRFAKVFDLTYTRFNDLKIAEHHAEQAELDLVKLQTEKKRAEDALSLLKATQTQLIQKEKLASLGELTAGIAHEIQNPLNFVNNFSELSVDLVKDLKDEIEKPTQDKDYIGELFDDLSQNQEKINHHGKRASSIVKGMLEHSRASTGVKELADINKLADEYLRLAYHGLRAKDDSFNADYELIVDENLPKIEVIPQDMGRVLLNLINNAFYAVNQRKQLSNDENYTPSVLVTTQQLANQIIIKVKDNGVGMSEAVRAKVFQPFFTTKPTGQGTGLGLSLAYDIVTKGHGGTLEVNSTEWVGSEFIITLLIKTNQ